MNPQESVKRYNSWSLIGNFFVHNVSHWLFAREATSWILSHPFQKKEVWRVVVSSCRVICPWQIIITATGRSSGFKESEEMRNSCKIGGSPSVICSCIFSLTVFAWYANHFDKPPLLRHSQTSVLFRRMDWDWKMKWLFCLPFPRVARPARPIIQNQPRHPRPSLCRWLVGIERRKSSPHCPVNDFLASRFYFIPWCDERIFYSRSDQLREKRWKCLSWMIVWDIIGVVGASAELSYCSSGRRKTVAGD